MALRFFRKFGDYFNQRFNTAFKSNPVDTILDDHITLTASVDEPASQPFIWKATFVADSSSQFFFIIPDLEFLAKKFRAVKFNYISLYGDDAVAIAGELYVAISAAMDAGGTAVQTEPFTARFPYASGGFAQLNEPLGFIVPAKNLYEMPEYTSGSTSKYSGAYRMRLFVTTIGAGAEFDGRIVLSGEYLI